MIMAKIPTPLKGSKDSTDHRRFLSAVVITDKATKRVLAPFVPIVRKGLKPEVEVSKEFSFYLQKKPSVLLRDLSSFLSDSVDLPSLLHETSDVLKYVTKAAYVTLYMIDSTANELVQSKRIPVEERFKVRYKIQEGSIIAAYAAIKKEYVMVDDIISDDRFPDGVGYESEKIKSVLCVPVVTPDGDCFAVIELYRHLFEEAFTIDDLKISIMVTGWMGAAIHQNQERLDLKRQQELNDYLLELTKCYCTDTVVMEKMISEVVKFAKVSLGAERGVFYIIDPNSEDMLADFYEESEEGTDHKKAGKVRFNKEQRGIAGQVARSGVTINIKDAYNDPRFNKEVDQKYNYITRSVICMPIVGMDEALGVIQIINKKTGGYFTPTDESLLKTFSMYCGLALHYTTQSKKVKNITSLNNINKVLLRSQMEPCVHDMERFTECTSVSLDIDFDLFEWYLKPKQKEDVPLLALHMIRSLISDTDINTEMFMRFILQVRKLHSVHPYHNFDHAFMTLHTLYVILRRNMWKFSSVETKALLLAALCHDIAHPGLTNLFLQQTYHEMSKLFQSSFIQNETYQVAMMLLKENKIFVNMTPETYKRFSEELKNAILATDIENFFRNKAPLEDTLKDNVFDWSDEKNRNMFKGILMQGCDLSGFCKPFYIARKCTENLYAEYYKQGGLENEMGLCTLRFMNKKYKDLIPEDQLMYVQAVMIPCYKIINTIFPNTSELCRDAEELMRAWTEIISVRGQKCWRQDDSIVMDH